MASSAKHLSRACLIASACLVAFAAQPLWAQSANTTFFLTSVGPGNGANLGGLAGAVVADFVLEIHDTHHPLSPSLY